MDIVGNEVHVTAGVVVFTYRKTTLLERLSTKNDKRRHWVYVLEEFLLSHVASNCMKSTRAIHLNANIMKADASFLWIITSVIAHPTPTD